MSITTQAAGADGQDGVGNLLTALFDYGTTSLDRTAFHKALDAIAATESGGSDFTLAVPSAHFDAACTCWPTTNCIRRCRRQAFDVQQKTLARTLAGGTAVAALQDVPRARQGTVPGRRSGPA